MGTSSSNPGPGSTSPLLPPWVDPAAPPPDTPPPPARFRPFRISLGKYAKSGNVSSLRSALGSYTRSGYGGSANAAKRLSGTAKISGTLHSLLSEIAGGGDGTQTIGRSLGELEGMDVDSFIDSVVDALCPERGTIDDELLRQGLDQALSNCLQGTEQLDLSSLTHDMLVAIYMEFIAEEVSNRIISDSKNSFNVENAIQRENELRQFVRSTVDVCAGPKFEQSIVQQVNPASFEQLVSGIIKELFELFEGF